MELLLGFLKNPKYKIYETLGFLENYMIPLRESGVMWGYELQHLFTGLLNHHPREAIAFTNDKRTDYAELYKLLMEIY